MMWNNGPAAGTEEVVRQFILQVPTEQVLEQAKQFASSSQVPQRTLNDWIVVAEAQLESSLASSSAPSPVLAKEITNLKATLTNVNKERVYCCSEHGEGQWVNVLSFPFKIQCLKSIKVCAYGKIKRGLILTELGQGKFGPSANFVAVKASKLELNAKGERVTGESIFEDVEKELAIMSLLSRFHHPHILELIFSGRDDVYLYTVTLLGQCSVWDGLAAERLEGGARLAFLLRVRREMSSALWFLHSLGFAHRDVSLENMIIMSDGSLKMIDFGLCVSLKLENKTSGRWLPIPLETKPEGGYFAVGKMRYLSPEFFVRNQDLKSMRYDAQKADVFALGVCLYFIWNRTFPYQSVYFEARLEPNLQQLVRFWNDESAKISYPGEIEWLGSLLCRDPESRMSAQHVCSLPI